MSDKFIPLAKGFFVAPQIDVDDVAAAKEMGIKLIISNRPDGEEIEQPLNEEIANAAKQLGIKFYHIPVDGRGIGKHHINDFKDAIEDHEGPILAFCRSGTRSTMVRAFYRASYGDVIADILEEASTAGYDLYTIVPSLEAVIPERRRKKRTRKS